MVVPTVLSVAKVTVAVASLWQSTWLAGWFTCPAGFTVMVNVFEVPAQLTEPKVKVGVTVMVATCGMVVVFVAVNEAMLPVFPAIRLMEVLSFVQL